jgi:hypothetical protein
MLRYGKQTEIEEKLQIVRNLAKRPKMMRLDAAGGKRFPRNAQVVRRIGHGSMLSEHKLCGFFSAAIFSRIDKQQQELGKASAPWALYCNKMANTPVVGEFHA